jgi:hypothetical protein
LFFIQNFEGNLPFIIFSCNSKPPSIPNSILHSKPPQMASLSAVTLNPTPTPKNYLNIPNPSFIMRTINIFLKVTSKSLLAQKEKPNPIKTKTNSFLNQLQATIQSLALKPIPRQMEKRAHSMDKISFTRHLIMTLYRIWRTFWD